MLDWLTYDGLSMQQFFNPDVLAWKRAPSIMVLHSTEGAGFPSPATYGNGRRAPHFTVHPRARQARQHYPLTQAAWALVAPADGTHTNTGGAIQLEIVGTCDPRNGVLPSVLTLDDGDLGYLAGLLRVISDAAGIPLVTSVDWRPYPESYGANGVRLSRAQWEAYVGVLGHQHVPGNTHGDPGSLNIGRLLELAAGSVTVVSNPVTPPPPPPEPPAPPAPTGLVVDGIWGDLTTKALQRALGVTDDGIIGPITRKALQRRIGVTADGIWGPITHKALQRHLGVTADGIWGPITVKALQDRLNAGSF
ncbi:peptidoglycan-binding domain-containing protein [Cellulomonas sp. WB94]|uniref:peptidoglycan-binding domain-containing protein n=1 Tax=Cellulomonas sp. WB94 TaxID=2173174 RepID=UPI001304BA3F|nr:peptidoglycan-binding domain-containing protein [Cellulomonas sp. WB94]